MKDQARALKDLYKNLRFTQIVHEKEAYVSKLSSTIVKLINIGLISLILLFQFLQLRYSHQDFTVISIVFAVIEVAIQAFQLSFNFENKHDQHRTAAKRAAELKNILKVHIGDVSAATSMTIGLRSTRDEIIVDINQLYKSAPQTGFIAKKLAKRQYDDKETE